jgi:uncharacterized membrane protein (DUF2068 family)
VRTKSGKRKPWILLIAILKLLKGVLLLAVAVGAIGLLHHDLAGEFYRWIRRLNLDVNTPFIQAVPSKVEGLTPGKLGWVSGAAFIYAAMFLTEGGGLLMRKRWAEYLTVIITASFLPFEIYELVVQEFGVFKLVLLIVNAAIVVYLGWHLRVKRDRRSTVK